VRILSTDPISARKEDYLVTYKKTARRFHAKATPLPSPKPNGWAYSRIAIFDGDAEIGSYTRNYPAFGEPTFEPFELGGTWYALYAPDYTSTRIMRLPDCQHLGGEEAAAHGFCPVEFFVPRYRTVVRTDRETGRESEEWWFESQGEERPGDDSTVRLYDLAYGPWLSLDIGFVAGCHWGDDNTWKLEVIDLSRAAEGIVSRSARFGHLQLGEMPLVDAIHLDRHMPHWELRATIIRQERRDVRTGVLIDPYDE
jgi:hypothetical protein